MISAAYTRYAGNCIRRGTGRVVLPLRAQSNHRTYAILPMDAEVLLRARLRWIARINKEISHLYALRDALSFPVRSRMQKDGTPKVSFGGITAKIEGDKHKYLRRCRTVRTVNGMRILQPGLATRLVVVEK
jgi:hypothetical protein